MNTTTPGGMREGPWITAPDGAEISVAVRRGFDCRMKCEHVPPEPNEGGQNHGQHCDEWHFRYRVPPHLSPQGGQLIDACAVQLVCFSWIRNGAVEAGLRRRTTGNLAPERWRGIKGGADGQPSLDGGLLIYGAMLSLHRWVSGGEACHLLGHCEPEFLGYLFSADFFEQAHSDAIEPLAVKPVDAIDLVLVTDVVSIWGKLAAIVKEQLTSS